MDLFWKDWLCNINVKSNNNIQVFRYLSGRKGNPNSDLKATADYTDFSDFFCVICENLWFQSIQLEKRERYRRCNRWRTLQEPLFAFWRGEGATSRMIRQSEDLPVIFCRKLLRSKGGEAWCLYFKSPFLLDAKERAFLFHVWIKYLIRPLIHTDLHRLFTPLISLRFIRVYRCSSVVKN